MQRKAAKKLIATATKLNNFNWNYKTFMQVFKERITKYWESRHNDNVKYHV